MSYEVIDRKATPARVVMRLRNVENSSWPEQLVMFDVYEDSRRGASVFVWRDDPTEGEPGNPRPPWAQLYQGTRFVPWFIVEAFGTFTPAGAEYIPTTQEKNTGILQLVQKLVREEAVI